MTRLRERNADLEARNTAHATRIEQLESNLTAARSRATAAEAALRDAQRRIRALEAERLAQADIIRRRNDDLTLLRSVLRELVAAAQPVPDTGTPGVEVTR
ncbi:hypothetical protein VSR01_10610 [Actinacidiphila sp. DG2A-62]|uniref:hypothetical protein n=1 Tax=Actinacidiphila sp. DG2A-62 TaxID=3108821 RepID=UPI002DBD8EDD|nr:hypothetical protein [Actinacidiphila sp. DG2A-62]MEC3993969.1 hypothetical protein [Actinacidiphila sp. DG2A-62]